MKSIVAVLMAASVVSSAFAKPILVVNEDNDHFFKLDSSRMTHEGLLAYADSVMQGPATHFFLCVNGQRTSYDSKTWEPIWTNLETDRALQPTRPDGTHDIWAVNAKKIFDQGIDPYEVWIGRCREKGVSPWISMRMNDIHFMDTPDYFRNSTFCRMHPEFWRKRRPDPEDWDGFALDYTHPEVREYTFAQCREVLSRWDADGVELDWMRSGYYFPKGHAREGGPILTEFMRRVRKEADAVSVRRGRKLKLAVRVPRSPEVCRAMGFEIDVWLREKLVDWVVGSSYLYADADIPVAAWKALIAKLSPGTQFVPVIDNVADPNVQGRRRFMTPGHYRSVAERFYRGGADGVYLFNAQYLTGTFETLCREGLAPETIARKERIPFTTRPDFPRVDDYPDEVWKIVTLPPGEMRLTNAWTLTARDSHTVYRGAADGTTHITAAVPVGPWRDCGGGVWRAKAPCYSEVLFVNGRRADRSRYPAEGFFRVSSATQIVDAASSTGFRNEVVVPDGVVGVLTGLTARQLGVSKFLAHIKWNSERAPIASVRGNRLVLEGAEQRPWKLWTTNEFYAVENVPSAFVRPGQWLYEGETDEIAYRPLPGERIKNACVPRDGQEEILRVAGASDVFFENVTFAVSAPIAARGPTRIPMEQAAARSTTAAVVLDWATNVNFVCCRFAQTGSYGVWFREGCSTGGVFDCTFTDLGAGGVRIGVLRSLHTADNVPNDSVEAVRASVPCVDCSPWMTREIRVENCVIEKGGRFHPEGIGVLLTHASDCRIVHNDIRDFYYTGVSLGWVWGYGGSPSQRNLVAYNRIRDIGQRCLADMGGIYTLGASFGTRIVGNVIHDIRSNSYGGWGLYNDEGSQGIVLENNLVYATDDASYHLHYGKGNVLRNNILVDSGCGQIAVSRDEPHVGLHCQTNVIVWTKGDAFGIYPGTKYETAKVDWCGNIWWRTDGVSSFNGTNFTAWARRVGDRGSVFADPGMSGVLRGDYSVRSGSAAVRRGFVPFDPATAGVMPSPCRHSLD